MGTANHRVEVIRIAGDHHDTMTPTVSIIMPAHNRGHLLGRTLSSIRQQEYPSLEVLVIEDGDDGITQSVASEYGAKHIRSVRSEAYPPFQSLAAIRNLGLRMATGDIIITQDAETMHEGDVIQPLVAAVASDRILAVAKTKILNQQGETQSWLSGFVGACPSAICRSKVLAIGGYEEQFFGYGCEDDWYVQLLNWNGVQSKRVDAVAAHQWHEPTPFEPYTGNANRALCWALTTETLWGNRPPRANIGSIIRCSDGAQPSSLDVNVIFDLRNIASAAQNEQPFANLTAYAEQQSYEALWGAQWALLCESAIQTADREWAVRLQKCREHYLTLSDVASRAMRRVLNGEVPRSNKFLEKDSK